MKKKLILIMAIMAMGCGAESVFDAIETTTHKLKPIVTGWPVVCQKTRACMQAAGEDTTEIEKVCEAGWTSLQILQAIQETTIRAAGGEPCLNCSIP